MPFTTRQIESDPQDATGWSRGEWGVRSGVDLDEEVEEKKEEVMELEEERMFGYGEVGGEKDSRSEKSFSRRRWKGEPPEGGTMLARASRRRRPRLR